MPQRQASAAWQGDLMQGQGTMRLGSGAYEGKYSFQTRMEEQPGTNPEELIGAALAGCFSMALAGALAKAGATPTQVETDARVTFEKGAAGWTITRIDLTTRVAASGVEEARFQEIARETKQGCPVSRALAATEIGLTAQLIGA